MADAECSERTISISEGDGDFEVVSGALDDAIDSSAPSSSIGDGIDSIDPCATFIMIREEQEAAQQALEEQKALLVTQLENLEAKSKEFKDLKNVKASMELALDDRDKRIEELKKELDCFKRVSQTVDEMTAKLYEAEEKIKYQGQIISQFQTHGFVEVNPRYLTDERLTQDFLAKDAEIEAVRKQLGEMSAELAREQEAHSATKRKLEESENLAAALQQKIEFDELDIDEVRTRLGDEISVLRAEIDDMRRRYEGGPQTAPSASTSSGTTIVQPLYHADDSRRAGPLTPPNTPGNGEGAAVSMQQQTTYTCDRCYAKLANSSEFSIHSFCCPAERTNFD